MIGKIKKLLGFGAPTDYVQMMKNGAIIIDVRSKGEFEGGHIKGSINIPVQNLENNLNKLKKDKTIIACCASGMRSASAKRILLANGFKDVHNGGNWMSLERKLN